MNGLVYRTRSGLVFRRFLIRISDYILTDTTSIRPRPLASKFTTVHHSLTNLTTQQNSLSLTASKYETTKATLLQRLHDEGLFRMGKKGKKAPPQTLATALQSVCNFCYDQLQS